MSTDPTGIKIAFDPTVQRMTGITAHGFIPFDVPYISEVVPGLWQGGCKNGLLLPKFIKHVVSLYPWESYKVRHELETSLSVRVRDATDQDMSVVDEIARWVTARRKTGPCLVHCQAGLNRSSLVVARVLMLEGATADEAIGLLREKRSPACLCNPAFEEWLRARDSVRGSFASQCTRVYLPRGRVAHLRRPWSPGVMCPSVPGTPGPGEWLGTGSQGEYDKAASLPLCRRCQAATRETERTGS